MGSEALLQRACELAFAVAREDAEADPAVEPPGDMRSFLYLARLPRRAIAVAQQAIEDDSDFRSRVAARATQEEVGRAGYLWLHRPIGWAPEFEELAQRAEDGSPDFDPDAPLADVPIDDDLTAEQLTAHLEAQLEEVESLSPIYPSTAEEPASILESAEAGVNGTGHWSNDTNEEYAMATVSDLDPEADAIESELTSLRGLVDRLAGERELVMSGSTSDTPDNPDASLLQDELATVSSELDYAREEMARVTQDLATVRNEREEARRQQSEALKRQVEVERELATVREDRAQVETRSSELQAQLISIEDRLKRIEGDLEETVRERNVVQSQLETMTAERNQIREDRMAMKAERDSLQARLTEVDEKTGGVDVGELTAANRTLTQELESTSRELARMISQVETYEEQLQTTTSTAESLKADKIELTSRLADVELALETTRTQHNALKDDAERLAAEVGTLRAERDGLQSQLTELQASLSDVLDEHAEIRHRNDADRKALNELRVERDVLVARMNDIEQADRSYENRINALSKERDDLMTARDDLMAERGELRGEMTGVVSARDQLLEKIDALENKLGPLEVELQAERRQREELANRLLELDDIAATNQSAIEELTGERDRLATERIELDEKLEQLEAERVDINKLSAERDELTSRLERTEAQRDDESTKRVAAASELSEQIAALESSKTALENQISEAQSELTRVRSDIDELNRENAKLRFNLQVAETTATEATDAAEEARRSGAAAAAQAAAAQARAERAEAEAAEMALFTAFVEAPAPVSEPTAEVEVEPEPVSEPVEATDEPEQEAKAATEPVIEPEPAPEVEPEPAPEVDAVIEPVPTEDTVGAAVSEEPASVAEEADEDDAQPDTQPEVETDAPVDVPVDVPAAVEAAEDAPRAEVGVDEAPSTVVDDEAPSILEPETHVPSEAPSSFDQVPSAFDLPSDVGADEVDEPVAAAPDTIPAFTPVSDVVDMEARRRDEASPFNNDWKAVGAGEPDELDEISELISQTVSGFDGRLDSPVAEPPGFAEPPSAFADDPGQPPSVFGADVAAPPSAFDDGLGNGAAEYGVSSRRQIEIPPEIANDEIAVAQHVVSSPDVVLLVDGDSVAKLGWPSLPVAQQRDALVTYLADLSATSGAAPDVVFDGRIGDDDSLPISRAVRIRLSTPPTEPAAALDELVSAYPDQWPIALVTDDSSLASSARERGAVVLNNGQLLDLFIAQ
ncbi:MAG: hypothetical protein OEZ14_00360 [Acidimicrobiia bacterium]|nr:hypothetical protein [Acidimicrobiia bacterium]MDH5518959.1 hypothetical protein [Acidimicrobiia bacterium]